MNHTRRSTPSSSIRCKLVKRPPGTNKIDEQRAVVRQQYARKFGFQKIGVPATVFKAVEQGVKVVKDVLRAKVGVKIAYSIRGEFETDRGSERFKEFTVEIRFPTGRNMDLPFCRKGIQGKDVVNFFERNRVVLDDVRGSQDVFPPASNFLLFA